jgi:RHH-type transcriptional regulator, proline utilization regulon repressor / proline dehydrogenase / delta 1-pyrroline-5-carboxylate dehydrogenase
MLETEIVNRALKRAKTWQDHIVISKERDERDFELLMSKLFEDPQNKLFLIELLDQSFRSNDPKRIANQLEYLFKKYEKCDFFPFIESVLLVVFKRIGLHLPHISIPLFIKFLREDVNHVVIKGENEYLMAHIRERKREGTMVNLNFIGESVLGEEEARYRLNHYKEALLNPDITYLSIKISTIFSQIEPLAHAWSVDEITKRITEIYEVATASTPHKFVNLDMEEYRDLRLSIDAFKQTLSQPQFQNYHAGIVLQSYLPDSYALLQELITWAQERVKRGGAPIKVRLVKGANEQMEASEASLRGWENVVYTNKVESDANYKKMMLLLLDPSVNGAVKVGIASHNLFEQAFAYELAKESALENDYSAEMLEGMSMAAYRTLQAEGVDVILYAPVATKESFTNAIAYLVRRFDENTAEENFLRHTFDLHTDSKVWQRLEKGFLDSIKLMDSVKATPYRVQDRTLLSTKTTDNNVFENEADTDFKLPKNQEWAEKIVQKFSQDSQENRIDIDVGSPDDVTLRKEVFDKSKLPNAPIVGSYPVMSGDFVNSCVQVAKEDSDAWAQKSLLEIEEILLNVAQEFVKRRGDLIGVAATELGKTFNESDVEVSEAIDFLRFYPYTLRKLYEIEGFSSTPKGAGVVISPWNFPIAIPVGGIVAALASQNCVILKPASSAMLCAQILCECFWAAGVSKRTLQLLPTSGEIIGKVLIPHRDIDFVIFTGSEETAYRMNRTNPKLQISAETGGKDATIVTDMADKDLAIFNVVKSAFSNSGQKCSATSLLVLEAALFDDAEFKERLVDAATSLSIGSPWELQNRLSLMANKPSQKVEHALHNLEESESWALEPQFIDNNPYMMSPGIRWGTMKGDFCHHNELFAPILSVLRAENLDEAIEIVNDTGYGLTSGIESLDEREQERWREKIFAGNLYINRSTTGAIVQRQPFGGWGKSSFGSGLKAGGLSYISQFVDITISQHSIPKSANTWGDTLKEVPLSNESFALVQNFEYWNEHFFKQENDYANIRGESNVCRFVPIKNILLVLLASDTKEMVIASIMAARIVGVSMQIGYMQKSDVSDFIEQHQELLLGENCTIKEMKKEDILAECHTFSRLRFLSKMDIDNDLYTLKAQENLSFADAKFCVLGRIELLHYYHEQSISTQYHRYGNLGSYSI